MGPSTNQGTARKIDKLTMSTTLCCLVENELKEVVEATFIILPRFLHSLAILKYRSLISFVEL